MKSGINVVSFFDGMGCLYVALKELAIPIESYHAYEIDKHAMKAAKALNPNVIHKGDVRFFDIKDYPDGVQIFAGGSPCTDLSFAGKMSGLICNSLPEYMELRNEYLETKDENLFFHNGKFQQSILFWEWLRALKEIQKVNPGVYFLLENVIMPKQHENTISKELGIASIRINANLVSAQNRDRNFWTNISLEPFGLFGDLHCTITQPKDRGILLKHILESEVKEKYYLSDKMLQGFFKHTQKHKEAGNGFAFKPKTGENKGNCLTSRCHKMGVDDNYIKEFKVCLVQGRGEEAKQLRKQGIDKFADKELMPRYDGKTNCLTSVKKDNLVMDFSENINTNNCLQSYGINHIFVLLNKYNEKSAFDKRNTIKALLILLEKIRERTEKERKTGIYPTFWEKKILQSTMYVRGVQEKKVRGSFFFGISQQKQEYYKRLANREEMRIMWQRTKFGHTPQGFQLEEQLFRKFADFVQVVSHEKTQNKKILHNMWKTKQGVWILREALSEIQKIWRPIYVQREPVYSNNTPYRIRRLSVREAGRLQSIPESDLDIMLNCGVSDSQLYKIYGNGWNCEVVKHILSYIKL